VRDLVRCLYEIVKDSHYRGEVRENILAVVTNRIEGLCQGLAAGTFAAPYSYPSIADVMRAPVIVETVRLSTERRALLMLSVLSAILQQLNFEGPSQSLRYVIVIEEAEQYIGTASRAQKRLEGASNPRAHAAELISRLIAEARGVGCCVDIVTQYAGSLPELIFHNIGNRIAHRATDAKERELIAGAMRMDAFAQKRLAGLTTGQFYLYAEHLPRAVRAQCTNHFADGVYPKDDELHALIRERSWFKEGANLRRQYLFRSVQGLLRDIEELFHAAHAVARDQGQNRLARDCMDRVRCAVAQAREKVEDLLSLARLDRSLRDDVPRLESSFHQELNRLVRDGLNQLKSGGSAHG
jgi:hypothetical protein